MKCELVPVQSCYIRVGEKMAGPFFLTDKWNGLLELRTGSGESFAIVQPAPSGGLQGKFEEIMSQIAGKDAPATPAVLVQASSAILDLLIDKEAPR